MLVLIMDGDKVPHLLSREARQCLIGHQSSGVLASGSVDFGGSATVMDSTKFMHAPLVAEFPLDLKVVESVKPSLRPTDSPSLHPTTHQLTEQPLPELELIVQATADSTVSLGHPNDTSGNLQAIAINCGSLNSDSDRFYS